MADEKDRNALAAALRGDRPPPSTQQLALVVARMAIALSKLETAVSLAASAGPGRETGAAITEARQAISQSLDDVVKLMGAE